MSTHVAETRKWSAECDCGWTHGSWTTKQRATGSRDYHTQYCPEENDAYLVEL